jgi:hypothetical protein
MPNPVNYVSMSESFADISTASTIWFSAPEPGRGFRVQITLVNAITTADSLVTVKVDNTSLTGTLTVAFTGSAKGTTFTKDFVGNIKQGSLIEIISDGASSTASIAPCTVTIFP